MSGSLKERLLVSDSLNVLAGPTGTAIDVAPAVDIENSNLSEQWSSLSGGSLFSEVDEPVADNDTSYISTFSDIGNQESGTTAYCVLKFGTSALPISSPRDLAGSSIQLKIRGLTLSGPTTPGWNMLVYVYLGTLSRIVVGVLGIDKHDISVSYQDFTLNLDPVLLAAAQPDDFNLYIGLEARH